MGKPITQYCALCRTRKPIKGFNINLIDTQAPQGSNPFVCSATATIRLVADAWARPILQSP